MRLTITSEDNPRLKKAIRLHTSRGRKTQGRIFVFGCREIQRAVENGVKPEELFVCQSLLTDDAQNVLDLILVKGSDFSSAAIELPLELFQKVCFGDRADGLVMTAGRPQKSMDELSAFTQSSAESAQHCPVVAIAQSIEKPGNLGAIMRSIDGSGLAGLIVADPMTDWFHPNTIRSSMGTAFSIKGAIEPSATIETWLSENRIQVLVASLQSSRSFYDFDLTQPTAIVLGNEATGVSETWRQYEQVHLPMHGIADSLNVSATAAVMAYEARRQIDFNKTT